MSKVTCMGLAVVFLMAVGVAAPMCQAVAQDAAQVEAKGCPNAEALGWRLGCQAYSFHPFTFFEAVDKVASLGLKYIEAYPGQSLSPEKPDEKFDHNMSEELRQEALAKLKACDVKLVHYGVVGLPRSEALSRKVFDFAKAMGIETIVSEPDPAAMDTVEKLVEEYGINVAIHNHPNEESKYWNPDMVLEATKDRSKRIGSCADIGHWMRMGIDPMEALKKLEGRIISFHFKDLNEFGNKEAYDVPWGTGKADVAALLDEIKRQNIKAVFAIEYEHNVENSLPEIAECVAYFDKAAGELSK